VPIRIFQKLLPGGIIADIGCGNARESSIFETNGYRYVGIDISAGMLIQAREFAPGSALVKMNMHRMAFRDCCLDGFWAAASLIHVPKIHVWKVLNELRRVTKPCGAGCVILKEGSGENMVKKSELDERFYSFYDQNEMSNVLTNSGFEVVESLKTRKDHDVSGNTVWLCFFIKNR